MSVDFLPIIKRKELMNYASVPSGKDGALYRHVKPSFTQSCIDNQIFQAAGVAQKANCTLVRLDYQQEAGLMSSLPLGVNQIPNARMARWSLYHQMYVQK